MYFDVKTIPEFPNYDVTVDGRVFNSQTGREMTLSPTMQGELTVGLVKDGIQYRRSVKVLVARAFVDGETPIFNTPILLDLDKHNLDSANIRWRPRWFAWKYVRQFAEIQDWYGNGPIYDPDNEIQYFSIQDCAVTHGFLCEDIHESLLSGRIVFPTGERYVYT
jgi:hypothetical protein